MRDNRVWTRLLGLEQAVIEGVEVDDGGQVVVAIRPGHRDRDRCGPVVVDAEIRGAKPRPSVEPLARLDNEPDPLQPFAAAMALLRPQDRERSTICLDLLPAAGRRRNTADPAELIDHRLVGQALDAKLRDAGSLFEAQVLLCCQAAERPRAKLAMQGSAAQHPHRPRGGGLPEAADRPLPRRERAALRHAPAGATEAADL